MTSSAAVAVAADHGIHHFQLGLFGVLLAYAISVVGSVVGLACTWQGAHATTARRRNRWLLFAAVSIGGVGIWLMHFIAMLGMSIPGTVVRYHLGWTAVSALLAIAATYIALVIIGPRVRLWRLALGGLIMGLAVNLMHYMGMYALRIQGQISYDRTLVLASILIAVTAATAALWFTLTMRSSLARLMSALVMGVAVVGMHYTGMAAMRVVLNPQANQPDGLDVFTFLFPVFVLGLLALAIPISAIMLAGTEDRAAEEEMEDLEMLEEDAEQRMGVDDHTATLPRPTGDPTLVSGPGAMASLGTGLPSAAPRLQQDDAPTLTGR